MSSTHHNRPGAGPVVTTAQGAVRGRHEEGIAVFRDIPYAAPPTGAARFARPLPHAPWDGVRDATAPGPTAPQPRRDAFGKLDMSPYFGPGWVPGDDYLTVNVWTPSGRDGSAGASLPVLVFVHGGGFVAGSTRAPVADGAAFARDGVVLVTLNYRLGIPGFLQLPDAPDNRGVLDVLAALRWVRENIAGFGGDPGRVTLFGQSAGATVVGAVLASEDGTGPEGLPLRRAIMQSGSGLGAFTPEQAARVTRAAADALGVEPRADAFAQLPDARFVEIMPQLAGMELGTGSDTDPLLGLSPFSVVLDRQPAESIAAGRAAGVDLLIGTNTEEGNLYLAPQGDLSSSTAADVQAIAARAHRDPAGLVDAYRTQRPRASHGELRSAILGDALFGAGSRRLAEAHAAHPGSTTHVFEFAWRSQALSDGTAGGGTADTPGGELGAAHGMELPFVFDRAALPALHGPHALLGPEAPPADLAARMHAAWVAFAATGEPGWEPYGTTRRVMRIDGAWTLTEDPHGPVRRAWY
ncbi:carboxylesterase family protein [Streptomyces sp. N2-109]|uniref:Carboxylic ester hydrolase n=1 Tax=Streptomyces gossypii TaxID=2883101 RepID=A0ABT2JZI7_9ACTN|nr:carboxylesterase family protein [Streptomyces gossypii]MCT2593073.1 carboxylesterase family protein [Streptomyces gossypii]